MPTLTRWTNDVSLALDERARKFTTRGQSNLKLPVMDKPLYLVRGRGARLWDVDGNEYVDLVNSAGPAILGHASPEYVRALKEQIDELYTSPSGMCQTPLDVELAERFARHVPCAEKVRLCMTGSEAVHLAIRLARAYTKRSLLIRFEGHYHGWLDSVLGGKPAGDPPFAAESPEDHLGTAGRDPETLRQSLLLPWNDIEALERVLERLGERVALILMEPVNVNGGCCPPRPGYLQRVRRLCDRYGIVLGFDEVITGFRMGLGGAQGALGVTPDIATFGKAMGGGLPIAAVAGRRPIMDLLGDGVVGAGTFNGYPLGAAAALATFKILEEDDGAAYSRIDAAQRRLADGLREISRRRGIPALVQGPRGVFFYFFTEKPALYSWREVAGLDWERQARFFFKLVEEGVLLMFFGRWYVSAALGDEDVDRALEASDRALARL